MAAGLEEADDASKKKMKIKTPVKNKKGMGSLILLLIVLVSIVIIGFVGVMAISIVDIGMDELVPVMSDLGVLDSTTNNTNLSEYSEYTFEKAQDVSNAFQWLIPVMYVLALVGSIIFVMSVRVNPHPVYIGLYLSMMILMIFFCIVMSNMYEDIYEGDDSIATRLQEDQGLMSYMILFSPLIMTIIMVISGIFLFAKPPEVGGVI